MLNTKVSLPVRKCESANQMPINNHAIFQTSVQENERFRTVRMKYAMRKHGIQIGVIKIY